MRTMETKEARGEGASNEEERALVVEAPLEAPLTDEEAQSVIEYLRRNQLLGDALLREALRAEPTEGLKQLAAILHGIMCSQHKIETDEEGAELPACTFYEETSWHMGTRQLWLSKALSLLDICGCKTVLEAKSALQTAISETRAIARLSLCDMAAYKILLFLHGWSDVDRSFLL